MGCLISNAFVLRCGGSLDASSLPDGVFTKTLVLKEMPCSLKDIIGLLVKATVALMPGLCLFLSTGIALRPAGGCGVVLVEMVLVQLTIVARHVFVHCGADLAIGLARQLSSRRA